MKTSNILMLKTILLAATWNCALAQEQGIIKLSMLAHEEVVIINDKGEKELKREEVVTVIPGDHIIYTIIYENIGEEPADNIVINAAVAENMQYISNTAGGDDTEILFSIDGGKIFDKPENLKVTDENGDERPALAKDYTNAHWLINKTLPPGAKGEVFYRTQLE